MELVFLKYLLKAEIDLLIDVKLINILKLNKILFRFFFSTERNQFYLYQAISICISYYVLDNDHMCYISFLQVTFSPTGSPQKTSERSTPVYNQTTAQVYTRGHPALHGKDTHQCLLPIAMSWITFP